MRWTEIRWIYGILVALTAWRVADWFLPADAAAVTGIGLLMVFWWVQGVVPVAVVSLLPLVLFPTFGLLSMGDAAAPYGDPVVFLFLGGFMIGASMEKWNLHRRIALRILMIFGTSVNRVVLGFIIATAFLSMWISNTATTVMMWPIAMSVVGLLERESGSEAPVLSKALMLSVAYASSLGGMATLVGTPPNIVMRGIVSRMSGYEVGFLQWLAFALPLVILLLAITYFMLTRVLLKPEKLRADTRDPVRHELEKLGPMSQAEKRVLYIFGLTALLWISRGLINLLLPIQLNDTGIAIAAGIALFLTPSGTVKNRPLLIWDDAQKISWNIILLFGGGLSLASGMESSGLIQIIGENAASWGDGHALLLLSLLVVLAIAMSELMSNVALVNVFVPVVIGTGFAMNRDIMDLVIPVTLASSCGFMLPMATPPNALVFASGKLKIKDMVRVGIWLNLICAVLIVLFWYLIGDLIFPEITAPLLPNENQ